jgi:hypothetical protein
MSKEGRGISISPRKLDEFATNLELWCFGLLVLRVVFHSLIISFDF